MHLRSLRPIGCLKLQVIFRKRASNYRALLQKMTYTDMASNGSSPPRTKTCIWDVLYMCVLHWCVFALCTHAHAHAHAHTHTRARAPAQTKCAGILFVRYLVTYISRLDIPDDVSRGISRHTSRRDATLPPPCHSIHYIFSIYFIICIILHSSFTLKIYIMICIFFLSRMYSIIYCDIYSTIHWCTFNHSFHIWL